MKIIITILMLAAVVMGGDLSGEALRLRLDQVQVGMTRAQVNKIIPKYKGSPKGTIINGGAQFETYWIDQRWKVTIGFDYTGVTRDKSGKALERVNLGNKLISKPQLIREDMPAPHSWIPKTEQVADGKPVTRSC
jgi:hypothetical protein